MIEARPGLLSPLTHAPSLPLFVLATIHGEHATLPENPKPPRKESLDRRAVGLVLGLGSTEQRKQQVAGRYKEPAR